MAASSIGLERHRGIQGHRRGRPPTPAIPARQPPDPCNKLAVNEYICKIWTKEPQRFTLNPTHPGLMVDGWLLPTSWPAWLAYNSWRPDASGGYRVDGVRS